MPASDRSRVVQRTRFPQPGDEAALTLYVRAPVDAVSWTRHSLTIAPGGSASFATYFGAFPAGYWRAHTGARQVSLIAHFDGLATVHVCTADETVGRRIVATRRTHGVFSWTFDIGEGNWFWFEVEAGQAGTTVRDVTWLAEEAARARATVCITTHNRGQDCVRVLQRLAVDPAVTEQLVRVVVVDQGDRPLRLTAGFDEAAAALQDRLSVIEQINLGGSGGFSRGMIESLHEDADYVLLLDDDVLLEPESILRMLAFATRARGEVIVGAQMLSLTERTLLHSMGEEVKRRGFWWVPVEPSLAPADLSVFTIETTPALRRPREVDFNGWWMCLIPLGLIRRVGAALPMFIKWDDAEFGLRAAADGVPTVTLPGAAIWHMPWTGKDDGLDWQAYYQLRNRLVAALVHSASLRGGGVLSASFAQDVNHVLCMQYGSAAARRAALRDVLDGPGHLPRTIVRRTPEIRSLMARAGQEVVSNEQLPKEQGMSVPERPRGTIGAARRLVHVSLHQLSRPRSSRRGFVEAQLTRSQGKWWALGLLDTATVASATGTGAFVARRDRRAAVRLTFDAIALRARLWARWPQLSRAYRAAVPRLTSPSAWEELFRSGSGGRSHADS